MKISIITPVYPPEIGGPATYAVELAERLKNKHNIKIIAYANNPIPVDGVPLFTVSKKMPLPIRLFFFTIKIFIHSLDADVLYVQNAMAAGLPTTIVSKILRKPVVLKFVGDEAWERAKQEKITKKELVEFLKNPDTNLKIKLMIKIQKFVLKNVSIFTTPSKYLRDEIVSAYKLKSDTAYVNYNASEKKNKEETFDMKSRKRGQLICTARLTKWKGINGIIQAVGLLKEKIPHIKLIVAGDGPEMNNLKRLVKELRIEKNVKLLGKITRDETYQLRMESEIYILNSSYEGLPHTVLTSFSAGIPVIATDIPGTNEVVYNEKTGLLVPINDPKKLSEVIEKLLYSDNLKKELVKNAFKLLAEKFSWENHIKTLTGFFDSVVNKPSI